MYIYIFLLCYKKISYVSDIKNIKTPFIETKNRNKIFDNDSYFS
jgi:hypothetical protein